MEIRDPELKSFVSGLDGRFKQYEEDNLVELVNGERKTVKLKIAVSEIHDELKKQGTKIDKIENATEFLVDFSRLHKIAKKYNLYWVFGALISIFFSHNVWQPVLAQLIAKL